MQADKVNAMELAELVTKHCIDTVVLNACESAKGAANASNLAHVLTDAGVKTTIGMSFEVLSLSAELFMRSFYENLLSHDGHALDAASRARAALLGMPRRMTMYGVKIDLYDHMIPVLHCTEASLATFLQQPTSSYLTPELSIPPQTLQELPLHGRETAIFELENLLAQNPPFKVFLSGTPGIGKTALMRHACQWWKETGMFQTVIFLPLHEPEYRNLTYSTFLQRIQETSPSVPIEEKSMIKALNESRALLVLDSLDSVSWDPKMDRTQEIRRLNRFLQRLRRCAVVMVSRSESSDFDWNYSIVIGPLSPEAATSFGLKYLEQQDPTKRNAIKAREQLADFKQLIGMMAGNPLAIRMILYDLCMNLQSSDDVSIRSHVEALLNHRIVLLDDATYPYEEIRAVAELCAALLMLSPATQATDDQDAHQNQQIHVSQSSVTGSESGEPKSVLLPSDRALYFNLCLCLAGFWNHMFRGDFFAMMVIVINQAQHLVGPLDLEYLVTILGGSHVEGKSLVDCIQEYCMALDSNNSHKWVLEQCAQRATNAPSWMRKLLANELLHFVTSEDQLGMTLSSADSAESNVSFYSVNPIFTLLARSSFIHGFRPPELGYCMDLSMIKLYAHHLGPIYQRAWNSNERTLYIDGRRLAEFDFWNHLSIAMTYHRAPHYPKAPLYFGINVSRWCSDVPLDRLPFLELMTRKCTKALMNEVTNTKAVLSPQIEYNLGVDLRNPSLKYLWEIGQNLEICLGFMYELGSGCCSKMGTSDDFYLEAKDVHDNDPLFASNPFLDEKVKRTLKAVQLENTALLKARNNGAGESVIREIEESRKERLLAVSEQFGVDFTFERIVTSNIFQYASAYGQLWQDGRVESIEARFREITNTQKGPLGYEETEVVQERILKLQELLREDLPFTIRITIHRTLALNHRSIGQYVLANEHESLRREEELKIEPEQLAKIRAKEKLYEKHWIVESANSYDAEGHVKEVEILVEKEMTGLQTGLQTLSWDDASMLAKTYRIGLLLSGVSRYLESIPWLRRTVEGRRRTIGMDVEGVLEPVLELAKALKWCFQLDEAISQLKPVVLQALQQGNNRLVANEYFMEAQVLLGELISSKAMWQTPGAESSLRRDLFQEARKYLEASLNFYRDTYGANCAGVMTCMIDLAHTAQGLAEHQTAEGYAREAIRIRRADIEDPCDHFILSSESVLGGVLCSTGRHDEGEKLMSDVLQRRLSRYGISSVYTLDAVHCLGIVYEQRNQLDKARGLAIEHFDVLVRNGRLRRFDGGFSFGIQSLGSECFDSQFSRLLQFHNLTTEQMPQYQRG